MDLTNHQWTTGRKVQVSTPDMDSKDGLVHVNKMFGKVRNNFPGKMLHLKK